MLQRFDSDGHPVGGLRVHDEVRRHRSCPGTAAFLQPPDIADDPCFFDSLSDLDTAYVTKWKRLRDLLDNEFSEATE